MRLPLPVARAVVAVGSRPMGPPTPIGLQRSLFDLSSRLSRPPAGTLVSRASVGGRPAERVTCGDGRRRPLLFLHGGAFITGSPRTHRVFAAHLSRAAQAPVLVPDYRLAPEHPFPAAVDDAEAAFEELSSDSGPVAVVGDYAVASMALLMALRRRDAGRELPSALALVSPVVDLTLATSDGYEGSDPLLRRGWVAQGTAAFVGGADPVELSPLFHDLGGLPPTLLHVSEHERLRPEGERFARLLETAGVEVHLELLPRLWHDAHVHADLVAESADAVARLGGWLLGTVPA